MDLGTSWVDLGTSWVGCGQIHFSYSNLVHMIRPHVVASRHVF